MREHLLAFTFRLTKTNKQTPCSLLSYFNSWHTVRIRWGGDCGGGGRGRCDGRGRRGRVGGGRQCDLVIAGRAHHFADYLKN